jgi:hypothetical protein
MEPLTLAEVRQRTQVGTRFEVQSHSKRPELAGSVRTVTGLEPYGVHIESSDRPGDQGFMFWPGRPCRVRGIDADTFDLDYVYSDSPRARIGGTMRLRFLP